MVRRYRNIKPAQKLSEPEQNHTRTHEKLKSSNIYAYVVSLNVICSCIYSSSEGTSGTYVSHVRPFQLLRPYSLRRCCRLRLLVKTYY